MSIKLYAMTCGWLTGNLGYLMEGGEGEVELPIPSYLIEHPKGTALFDTGMHPACQRGPLYQLATSRPARPATALTLPGAASQIARIEIKLHAIAIQNAIE